MALTKDHDSLHEFDTIRWTIKCCNRFWRIVYGYGLWIPKSAAREAVQRGWSWLEPSSHLRLGLILALMLCVLQTLLA